MIRRRSPVAVFALIVAACSSDTDIPDEVGADLELGDVSAEDMKADGQWGSALTCKTIPNLPPSVPRGPRASSAAATAR